MVTERYIGKELKEKKLKTIVYLRDIKGLLFSQIGPQVGLTESAARINYDKARGESKTATDNWPKEYCLVCGRTFQYPECGYKPKTCSTFECVQKYNRNPGKYKIKE